MKTSIVILLAALSLLYFTLAVVAAEIAPYQEVVYKKASGVELKLQIFYPQGHKDSDRTPAIVFFFGGGWATGSLDQFYNHSAYLASRGMVAIIADYRVASRNNTTPFECVADGKSAIRWVRQHANELGIDPDRIAAGGGSAGGHVAAAAATLSLFDEPTEDLSVSSKPNALVLFNPVIDNGPDGYGYGRVKDRWQDFSPLHNLKVGAPPTIIFFGTSDKLVPASTARNYMKLMTEIGSRCDLFLYPDQPHGFFNYSGKTPLYYTVTLVEADKFLTSLGYLEGKPTIGAPQVAVIRE